MTVSTLDQAMAVENAADKVVYDAARGLAQMDNWRLRLDEIAEEFGIEASEVLDEIARRHSGLSHYGSGILGSIPDPLRVHLGLV